MLIDDSRSATATATHTTQNGTAVTLPIDGDVFATTWHLEHTPTHPAGGCPLCEPGLVLPSSFRVQLKSCCGEVLVGEQCECWGA